MSTLINRTSTLAAELRLAQAISDFNADLNVDQKIEISQNKEHIPGIEDVMRLTAEIDRFSGAKVYERKRCYGPRTTKFLLGIQQFATIADVAVGGSQIPVACGVWSVTSARNSSYIEKLSQLFMSIGQSSPQMEELADLYPHSARIRDKLIEYYIIVVKLCHELLKASRRNSFMQLFSGFADETYTQRLKEASEAIKAEVYIENVKFTKKQSRMNSAFILLSKENMALRTARLEHKRRRDLFDACSRYDYLKTWKQIRKTGTTMLFVENVGYKEWVTAVLSSTLLYSGKLGSGKSVLLANVVDDLNLQDGLIVTYFFCRYDIHESLRARTVIGCLVRQALQLLPNLNSISWDAADKHSQLDLEELVQLVKQMKISKKLYFVLDGVDDMSSMERRLLVESINILQEYLCLMVCIGTRKNSDSFFENWTRPARLLATSMPLSNPDIDAFIKSEIQEKISSGDLVVADPTIVEDIRVALSSKAEGMFLWVYLQITSLCYMESDYDVRKALGDLPMGLSETYSRLLKSQTKSPYRQTLFELITAAFEPLTTEQLVEALAVVPGNINFDPTRRINSIEAVLRSCGGMVIVDEEEDTVQLIHHSVRQFLTTTDLQGDSIRLETSNSKMSEVILTYLNYSRMETQVVRYNPTSTLSPSAIPVALIMKTIPLASRFIRPPSELEDEKSLLKHYHPTFSEQHHFKTYANAYWDLHLLFQDPSERGLKLLERVLRNRRVDLNIRRDGLTPLQMAVKDHRISILKVFLQFDLTPKDKKEALHRATILSDDEALDVLVNHYSDLNFLFFEAISNGYIPLLNSILRQDALVNEESLNSVYDSLDGFTPLSFAIDCKKVEIVKTLLIERKVNLLKESQTKLVRHSYNFSDFLIHSRRISTGPPIAFRKRLPLDHAVESGFLPAVELLSQQESVAKDYDTPMARNILWDSAVREWSGPWTIDTSSNITAPCEDILLVLLRHGILRLADRFKISIVVPPCYAEITPLMMAARHGRIDIIKALLDFDEQIVNETASGIFGTQTRSAALDIAANQITKQFLESHGGKRAKDLNRDSKKTLEDAQQ